MEPENGLPRVPAFYHQELNHPVLLKDTDKYLGLLLKRIRALHVVLSMLCLERNSRSWGHTTHSAMQCKQGPSQYQK